MKNPAKIQLIAYDALSEAASYLAKHRWKISLSIDAITFTGSEIDQRSRRVVGLIYEIPIWANLTFSNFAIISSNSIISILESILKSILENNRSWKGWTACSTMNPVKQQFIWSGYYQTKNVSKHFKCYKLIVAGYLISMTIYGWLDQIEMMKIYG